MLSVPAAIVLALALGSYNPNDPSFSVSTMSRATNYCGLWGAWTADLMLGIFGLSAWWFVLGFFMVAYFAVRALVRRHRGEVIPDRINPPKLSAAIGFATLLVGSAGLEALRLRRFGEALPAKAGGVLGDVLGFAVEHYIGLGLATVVFFVMMLIGISLLMDFSWMEIAERVGKFIDEKILAIFIKTPVPQNA